MLEVSIECIKVLSNIQVEKRQFPVVIVQQDANPLGGDCNPNVWGCPAVQKFIFVPAS